MLSCNHINPFTLRRGRLSRKRVIGCHKFHARLRQKPSYRIERIGPLIMRLLVSAEQLSLLTDKQRQPIFVDTAFFVVIILPDKASLLAILTDRCLTEKLLIFICGI